MTPMGAVFSKRVEETFVPAHRCVVLSRNVNSLGRRCMPEEERATEREEGAGSGATSQALAAVGRDAPDILRAVARMSPLPMVLTDPYAPDGPMIFCNRAFTQLTGYQEEEVRGQNMRFLQGELTDAGARATLRAAIAAGEECQVELWNYRKDGSKFWCSMFVGPVHDRDGRLAYWFGSQLDTTARREVDEARASAKRMDTLGSMAAGIAHEFNNLMTVVIGNAEAVRADPLTPRQGQRLDRIDWAAQSAGRLTQQMLSFAGRSSLHAEAVDLNRIVGDFDRLLSQVASFDRPVEVRLAGMTLPARIDVGQLELSLLNLVRNASDASEAGGRIVVSTSRTESGGRAEVAVAVTDEGSGMPPGIAARAADPFFTTKEHGKGTGLGLSMVTGFVQQSGGRMLIETAEGAGTTVRLLFPEA